MKIKRDKRDAIFSLLIRERANWSCQRCNRQFERGAANLHCSHLFGRRHRAARWASWGAVAHCAACHFYLTEHPLEFAAWVNGHFTPSKAEIYRRRSKIIANFSKRDLESIYKHLKAEHKSILTWHQSGSGSGYPTNYYPFKDAPEISALRCIASCPPA